MFWYWTGYRSEAHEGGKEVKRTDTIFHVTYSFLCNSHHHAFIWEHTSSIVKSIGKANEEIIEEM